MRWAGDLWRLSLDVLRYDRPRLGAIPTFADDDLVGLPMLT